MQKCLYWSCRKQIPRTRWKTNVELSPVWYWIQLEFEASHLMTWSAGALFCSRKLIRWLNSWLNRQIKTQAIRFTLLLKTFTSPPSYAKVNNNNVCSNYSRRWLRNWIGWAWPFVWKVLLHWPTCFSRDLCLVWFTLYLSVLMNSDILTANYSVK